MKQLSILFSWIFHPLFLLSYAMVLVMCIDPYLFGIQKFNEGLKFILPIFISTVIIPGFAIFMMKALGMIKGIELNDRMDRVGPYIVTGMFYLWLFKNLYTNNTLPDLITCFTLGCTITLFACFVINVVYKISVHAASIAGLTVMVMVLCIQYYSTNQSVIIGSLFIPLPLILFITIIIAGFIGTARLYLKAHTLPQVLFGYLVGITSMLIAVWYIH